MDRAKIAERITTRHLVGSALLIALVSLVSTAADWWAVGGAIVAVLAVRLLRLDRLFGPWATIAVLAVADLALIYLSPAPWSHTAATLGLVLLAIGITTWPQPWFATGGAA